MKYSGKKGILNEFADDGLNACRKKLTSFIILILCVN